MPARYPDRTSVFQAQPREERSILRFESKDFCYDVPCNAYGILPFKYAQCGCRNELSLVQFVGNRVGSLWPMGGESLRGLSAEQQIIRCLHRLFHDLFHHLIPIFGGPAAMYETA